MNVEGEAVTTGVLGLWGSRHASHVLLIVVDLLSIWHSVMVLFGCARQTHDQRNSRLCGGACTTYVVPRSMTLCNSAVVYGLIGCAGQRRDHRDGGLCFGGMWSNR